jgi:hypothetical protein
VETAAPEVEERQSAAPAEEKAEQRADAAPPAEPPPRELTLVYEINADEYFPADVELEEDHSGRSETRQLRAPATPERIEGAPLPYEGGLEEQGPAADESTEVEVSETGMKEAEPGPKIAEEKESADRSESTQLKLPRMD